MASSSTKSRAEPCAKGMGSFWREKPGELDNHRSTESLPQEADIVVVGGGFAGAAIVTHILRHPSFASKNPSIVVLEARELCSGATGRNGGHLKPDSYAFISTLARKHGVKAAAEVADFESANVAAVTDFICQQNIDCDFVVTRAVDVHFSDDQHKAMKNRYEKLAAAGVDATRGTFCPPEKYAERLSGVKGAKGLFSYTAGHVWPYKLIHSLFADAISRGVNLQTNTPATSLSRQQPGGRWTVKTGRGTILAKQVIVATNAYTSSLMPEYAGKIIPYRGAVAHIKTPAGRRAPLLPNTYSLRFSDFDFDYLIPRPDDGSIIVGGARRAYLADKDAWYGNVDDGEAIDATRAYFDGYMQRFFHGWEDSGAYVADLWTGIMGYSADRLPRVGHVPGREDVFVMAGFTGHGMPQVFLCGKGIADMVMDGASFNTTGIPRLFEETRARLEDPQNLVEDMYNEHFASGKEKSKL